MHDCLVSIGCDHTSHAEAVLQFLDANGTVVGYHALPLKLPHDYQYADAEPLSEVLLRFCV